MIGKRNFINLRKEQLQQDNKDFGKKSSLFSKNSSPTKLTYTPDQLGLTISIWILYSSPSITWRTWMENEHVKLTWSFLEGNFINIGSFSLAKVLLWSLKIAMQLFSCTFFPSKLLRVMMGDHNNTKLKFGIIIV